MNKPDVDIKNQNRKVKNKIQNAKLSFFLNFYLSF